MTHANRVDGIRNRQRRNICDRVLAQKILLSSVTSATFFQAATGASNAEKKLLHSLRRNARSIGVTRPLSLGLDSSLAQVALSLARRAPDPYASKSAYYYLFQREDYLDTVPANGKPAVWRNVKYTNRWLADGSI